MTTRLASLLSIALFAAACGSTAVTDDAGGTDAAAEGGGMHTDSGGVDLGPGTDLGTPDVDLGTPDVDLGTPDVDMGTPDVDLGVDAGPTGCMRNSDCTDIDPGLFCNRDMNCMGPGVCQMRPTRVSCDGMVIQQVCSCFGGMEYDAPCLAHVVGASVASIGACP